MLKKLIKIQREYDYLTRMLLDFYLSHLSSKGPKVMFDVTHDDTVIIIADAESCLVQERNEEYLKINDSL